MAATCDSGAVRIRCSATLGLVLLLTTLAACGSTDDGAAPTSAPVVSTSPEPTAPTTAPAAPCTWTVEADEPEAETETDGPSDADTPGGAGPDVAPHEAENNAWRQRGGLTAAEISTGTALAEQIRPVLVGSCEQGDFSPERLATALESTAPESWTVFTIQPRSAMGDPSTGVQLTLERDGTCLVGATAPGTASLRVTAPIADGGCWEPPSN